MSGPHYDRAVKLIEALEAEAFGSVLHGALKASITAQANALDSGRSTAYTCEFCTEAAPKDAWGPGRITCPSCGKLARAADGRDRNDAREEICLWIDSTRLYLDMPALPPFKIISLFCKAAPRAMRIGFLGGVAAIAPGTEAESAYTDWRKSGGRLE